MTYPENSNQEIRQLAFYEIHPHALQEVLSAISEFVDYVRKNEAGTLRYEVWQEREHPTRFTHIFVFRDAQSDQHHSESAAVKKFSGILYPQCLEPVKFIDYQQVDSKTAPSL